jgi:hypothetical protein
MMQVVVQPNGTIRCLYDENIDLSSFGRLSIRRASHVEPDPNGQWFADLKPMDGPILGPFSRRSDALTAESDWIEANGLADTG